MAVLGYLAKLKRGLGLAFGVHFLHDFSTKKVSYIILYQWTKFPCHNVLIYTVYGVINFKIFLGSTSKVMADREKKRKRQKFEYLEIEKSFLDEIKNILHSF